MDHGDDAHRDDIDFSLRKIDVVSIVHIRQPKEKTRNLSNAILTKNILYFLVGQQKKKTKKEMEVPQF